MGWGTGTNYEVFRHSMIIVVLFNFIIVKNVPGALFDINEDSVTIEPLALEYNFGGLPNGRMVLIAYTFYSLPISPLEITFEPMTLKILFDDNTPRLSYINMCFLPSAIIPGILFGHGDGFFGLGPIGFVLATPQILTNFKVQLPVKRDVLHLFLGETTDYFIYEKRSKVFTETKAGFKIIIGPVATECAISKPWLKAYSKDDKLFLSAHIGVYFSRKLMEKSFKEGNTRYFDKRILHDKDAEWRKKKMQKEQTDSLPGS